MIHVAGLGGCDFTNLPLAIGVCNMALPMLCVPMAFLLLPDMLLSDPIDENTTLKETLVEEAEMDVWTASFTDGSGQSDVEA